MPSLVDAARSQVGRKILTGITGILLSIFIIFHLIGNLTLFGSEHAFNIYSHTLHSMGWLLYVFEFGLLLVFLVHAYIGIAIYLRKRKRRPVGYEEYSTMGEPSKQTFSSRSMIFTGIILLIFTITHVATFKFGDTQMITVNGTEMKDLKALVIDTFQNPWYVLYYIVVMVLLGFHLRHGFWSAFTSLTMKAGTKRSAVMYTVGAIFAILMAVGFLFIPFYIYVTGGTGALIAS